MKRKKVVFKKYVQNQPTLFPPTFDDMVPAGHAVRVVNDVIERIDIGPVEKTYAGGGTSSYHPRMLLKVLVYAYLRNIYSSRKIEAALHENVHFMWLAGGAKPDHNTINDFRGKRLNGPLREIFAQVVTMLAEEGVLSLKELAVDGTKLEANANRYTFVWGGTIRTNRERIARQLKELWEYVEKVYRDDESQPKPTEMKEVSAEAVERAVGEINKALGDKEIDPKVRQKLGYAKKNWPKKLAEYDAQERIMAGRNSYSKTDPDATFMRMKEDHMKNGQLKPGYNLQLSTSGHYIVDYTLGQKSTDTGLLAVHLESHEKSYGAMPEEITADAGYGSAENYGYLEEKGIVGYVKYNTFDKEQRDRKYQSNPFIVENLHYNEERDAYYCPMGQEMRFTGTGRHRTASGQVQELKFYKAASCERCPMRGPCHKAAGERVIQQNQSVLHYRNLARERLTSEEGMKRLKERWKVEAVFGNVKHNNGFKRVRLRGLAKVTTESGLVALAHNLRRYATNH